MPGSAAVNKLLILGALGGGLYLLLRKKPLFTSTGAGQPMIAGGYTERPSATQTGKGVDAITSGTSLTWKSESDPIGYGPSSLIYTSDRKGPVQPGPAAIVAVFDPRGYATGTATAGRTAWFDNKSQFGVPVGDAYYQLRV